MKAEQLRKSILQLAIQGKLVPQDPNDEPASVLLERIREEKQKLIKEGKIKKDKIDSVIYKGEDNRYYEKVGSEVKDITDELPFEIPDSWAWVHLPNVAHSELGKTLDKLKNAGNLKPYLCSINVNWNKVNLTTVKTAKFERKEEEKYALPKGDLLICEGGEVGRCAIWESNDEMYYQNALHRVRFYCVVSPYYFIKVFEVYKALKILDNFSKGVTIKHLVQNSLYALYFPIPPLKEQARIVEKIEKFEPLIAEYDKLEQQATKLDDEIYDKLKKSILQYAIQGKLVPQDPNDEPASVLLERIRVEKKAKLGKKYVDSYIYKGDDNYYYEKVGANEPVRLDDLPFEIPDSWCWARLGNAVNVNPRNDLPDNREVSFVEMKAILDGYNNHFSTTTRLWQAVKSGFTHFQDGDVGFAKITPCFQNRKSVVFSSLHNGYGAGTTELHILRPVQETILPKYLLCFVKSPYLIEHGKQKFSGTAGQQRFGTDEVKKTLLPLPPLPEQERIVKQVETILEKLKDED